MVILLIEAMYATPKHQSCQPGLPVLPPCSLHLRWGHVQRHRHLRCRPVHLLHADHGGAGRHVRLLEVLEHHDGGPRSRGYPVQVGAARAARGAVRYLGLADLRGLADAGWTDGEGGVRLPDIGAEEAQRMGPHRAADARQLPSQREYPRYLTVEVVVTF